MVRHRTGGHARHGTHHAPRRSHGRAGHHVPHTGSTTGHRHHGPHHSGRHGGSTPHTGGHTHGHGTAGRDVRQHIAKPGNKTIHVKGGGHFARNAFGASHTMRHHPRGHHTRAELQSQLLNPNAALEAQLAQLAGLLLLAEQGHPRYANPMY